MSFDAAQAGVQMPGQTSAEEEALALACARQPLFDLDISLEVIAGLSVRDLTRLAMVIAFEGRHGMEWGRLVDRRLRPGDVRYYYMHQLLRDADVQHSWLASFPVNREEDLIEAIERAQEQELDWARAWYGMDVSALEVVDTVLPELRTYSI